MNGSDMDKFRTITLFLTTTKTQSFTETAKLHATDPSTVSKAMSRLEKSLGVQLFHRTTRQLKLTTAGTRYAEAVDSLLNNLQFHEEELKKDGSELQGELKINLPVSYGRQYMLPMLAKFKNQYPQITLDVSFCDEYVDMVKASIDVSIRSGTVADSRLIAQKLTPIRFVLCVSSQYNQLNSIEITSESLSELPWIFFRFKQTGKTLPIDFEYQGKRITVNPKHCTIVDDGEALAELCAQNVGITIMPHFIAKKWVQSGALKVIYSLDQTTLNQSGVYLIYRKQEHQSNRKRAFIDFVKSYIEDIGESQTKTWLDSDVNLVVR